MSERGTYISLDAVKRALKISDTNDDVRLAEMIESASRQVDADTGRHFYVVQGTRYFTARDCSSLLVPDLLSVSALATDDGTRTYPYAWDADDYELLASDSDPDAYPRWQVVTAPFGVYSFPVGLRRGVRIASLWGYGDGASATPWQPSAIKVTVADATSTALTVTGGTLEIGQTILVGDEQMYVTAATTADRGVNGTTAAAHNAATANIARYPSGIVTATAARVELDRMPAAGTLGSSDGGTVSGGPAYARYRSIIEQFRVPGGGVMPGIYVRADIKGIEPLMAKLTAGDPIYAEPWRKALAGLKDEFLGKVRANAPRFSGRLDSSFTDKMDSKPVPEWAFVANDAKGNGGFAYPWALNVSDKYHRAGGKTSTKGWFTKPFNAMKKRVQDVLNNVAREIEAKWQA